MIFILAVGAKAAAYFDDTAALRFAEHVFRHAVIAADALFFFFFFFRCSYDTDSATRRRHLIRHLPPRLRYFRFTVLRTWSLLRRHAATPSQDDVIAADIIGKG